MTVVLVGWLAACTGAAVTSAQQTRPTDNEDPADVDPTTNPSGGDSTNHAGGDSSNPTGGDGSPTGGDGAPADNDPIPTPIAPAGDPGCGLGAAAFCETFDVPHPGGRGGDLDESRIALSRWSHSPGFFDRPGAWSRRPENKWTVQRNMPTLCGETFENVIIPNDARVCVGQDFDGEISNQFNEVFDDGGDFAINSMMIRQLFDFSNGGTIVFDVDAKRNTHWDGHGWWIEMWITKEPNPLPYHVAPTVAAIPKQGIGLQFIPIDTGSCSYTAGGCNQLGFVFITKDNEIVTERYGGGKFLVEDGVMNRFKIEVTPTSLKVYASDAGSKDVRLLKNYDNLPIGFERGYVHLQHSQYNAFKDARPQYNDGVWASPAQVYRWDNIGFDGPVYPPLRSYDFPDRNYARADPYYQGTTSVNYGYNLENKKTVTLEVQNVNLTGATRAWLNFNLQAFGPTRKVDPETGEVTIIPGQTLYYRLNQQGEWFSYDVQSWNYDGMLRSVSVEVPLLSLKDGTNRVEFKLSDSRYWENIGNADLSLELEE